MASCLKHGEWDPHFFACPRCFKEGDVTAPIASATEPSLTPVYDRLVAQAKSNPIMFSPGQVWDALKNMEECYTALHRRSAGRIDESTQDEKIDAAVDASRSPLTNNAAPQGGDSPISSGEAATPANVSPAAAAPHTRSTVATGETPRTDALAFKFAGYGSEQLIEHARQLERELAVFTGASSSKTDWCPCCKQGWRSATAVGSGWVKASDDCPPIVGVAWIDNRAAFVGTYDEHGKRYVLKLPTRSDSRRSPA